MYKVSYVSDGATTEYEFTFPFFQSADVHVFIDSGDEITTGVTVMPNADMSGGCVVFDVAPAMGVKIDILRRVSLTRVIDYQPTMQIAPESLNADFNFLVAAFQDIYDTNIDIAQWQNTHDNIKQSIDYTLSLINDKIGGGAVLGLYNNLLNVLQSALPELINDYGSIEDPAPNENCDDYGLL